MMEIYNEEIRDLLSKNPKDKLDLKENKDGGVYVKGLNAFVVKSVPEIHNVLEVGGVGCTVAVAEQGGLGFAVALTADGGGWWVHQLQQPVNVFVWPLFAAKTWA